MVRRWLTLWGRALLRSPHLSEREAMAYGRLQADRRFEQTDDWPGELRAAMDRPFMRWRSARTRRLAARAFAGRWLELQREHRRWLGRVR